MQPHSPTRSTWKQQDLFALLVGVLILKVTVGIVLKYRDYLPPNFNSDFLAGRQDYFFGSYQWAFWVHIFSGPVALILGLLLVSSQVRLRFPTWHRRLGRIQAINVLCLLVPSGLWMSAYAASGPIAGISFGTLAVLTGLSIAMGWRAALRRKFAEHRRWMLRNFTLLCSAVVLRLVGGTATVFEYGPDWFDPLASWACWLVPLTLLELSFARSQRTLSILTDLFATRNGHQGPPSVRRNRSTQEFDTSVTEKHMQSPLM